VYECNSDDDDVLCLIRDKKRQQYYVIQGRFLQPLPFTHLYSGQFSTESLQQRPTSWLYSSLTKLQPGFQSNLATNTPYFLSPLFAVAQTISKFYVAVEFLS
jgi:hypothetical protein